MDHSLMELDVNFQCVKNTMDEMIEKIVGDQPMNFINKTLEKEANEKCEVSASSRQLSIHQMDPISEEDKVLQKKPNNCKFYDVVNSMFDNNPATDEDVRLSIEKLWMDGSERQLVNSDYIPLSCPIIKSNTDNIFSENDKSFIKFLDDMQSLTTKESPYAILEQHPVFHSHREKKLQNETDGKLSTCEQTLSSNLLTLQALQDSQESEHVTHFHSCDYEEQDIRTFETQALSFSYSGNPRRATGSPCIEGNSLKQSTKDVLASLDTLEENESVLNLDCKLVDNFPLYAENTFDERKSPHPDLILEEVCCLDQLVDRQLENMYSTADASDTETNIGLEQAVPDTLLEITNVATRSSRHHVPTPAYSDYNTHSLANYDSDKENLQCYEQREGQPESNIETTRFNTGYTDGLREECQPEQADQRKCSSEHHVEQIDKDESACSSSIERSEHEISGMKPYFHLSAFEQSLEHAPDARTDDTREADSEHVENAVINTDYGKMGKTDAEHFLQNPEMTTGNFLHNPEMTTENHPNQLVLDSRLKEHTDVASADTETGSGLGELYHSDEIKAEQCQKEDKSINPKDNKVVAQIQNNQIQGNCRATKKATNKSPEDSCSMQESSWSDQNDAEFQLQCNMEKDVYMNDTKANQSQKLISILSTSENTDTMKTQEHRDSVLQQPMTIQQASETIVPEINEGIKKILCPPRSHAMTFNDEQLDNELRSSHSKQGSFLQNKAAHRFSDQLVPDQSYLVVDHKVVFQEKKYIPPEPEESLYEAEESKLKGAKLPSPQFKWKYRPSCDEEDEDLITPVEEMETEVLGNIQPLLIGQCSRRLRIGLSRKQKVKRLHKNVN